MALRASPEANTHPAGPLPTIRKSYWSAISRFFERKLANAKYEGVYKKDLDMTEDYMILKTSIQQL